MKNIRLDKYLTSCTTLTRSEVKQEIKKNKITVNGEIAKDPGYHVKDNDIVCYDGKEVSYEQYVYYMFYKPMGCVSATKDRETTVLDYFKSTGKNDLFPVGRLDADTEGLLLVTNDGGFCHDLISPKKHMNKYYYFEGCGQFIAGTFDRMKSGFDIGDEKDTLPAFLMWQNQRENSKESLQFDSENTVLDIKITEVEYLLLNENEFLSDFDVKGILVITEGRFHQVKRMLQKNGVRVDYLKRLQIGAVSLDLSLNKGEFRALTTDECMKLGVK